MVTFKNKTISQIRKEILKFKGKEIETQSGFKMILGSVSKLKKYWCDGINYETIKEMVGRIKVLRNKILSNNKQIKSKSKIYGDNTSKILENHNFEIECQISELLKYINIGFKVETYIKQGENKLCKTEFIGVPIKFEKNKFSISRREDDSILSYFKL